VKDVAARASPCPSSSAGALGRSEQRLSIGDQIGLKNTHGTERRHDRCRAPRRYSKPDGVRKGKRATVGRPNRLLGKTMSWMVFWNVATGSAGAVKTQTFKSNNSLDKRTQLADTIRAKHPDRVPVVVEKSDEDKSDLTAITKRKKYLLPGALTMTEFLVVIRKRLGPLTGKQALFVFVNGVAVKGTADFSEMYKHHKDEDGFLYVTYCAESTFG